MAKQKLNGTQQDNQIAFSAYTSASTGQSVPAATFVDVVFDTEEFDTMGWYNNTNGRFTPQLPGKYQLNTTVGLNNVADTGTIHVVIKKNGSNAKWTRGKQSGSGEICGTISSVFDANGTTDYFTVAVWNSATATTVAGSMHNTWFSGAKV